MDYGCNGRIKIHFIALSQISKEGQCKTLHQGRTNKILFRQPLDASGGALWFYAFLHTHTSGIHTHASWWIVRPLQCSRTISYERYPIGIGSNPRALLFQAGLIAASSDLSRRKRENRRRPLPNQINSDGHRWTNWLLFWVTLSALPCVCVCTRFWYSPKRGTYVLCSTHSQVWQSRRCFYLLGNPALPDNAAAAAAAAEITMRINLAALAIIIFVCIHFLMALPQQKIQHFRVILAALLYRLARFSFSPASRRDDRGPVKRHKYIRFN